jgi:hypothetical protein
MAKCAPALLYIECGDMIALPFNQDLMTVMTIGVVPLVAGHIAKIDVMYAFPHGNIP